MFARPRVIQSRMVSHKVQKHAHSTRSESLAHAIQIVPCANASIGRVLCNRIWRADHVGRLPSRQRSVVIRVIFSIGQSNPPGFRTPLPHAHEPDDVKAPVSERVPFRFGNISDPNQPVVRRRETLEPRPCIDLVEMRMRTQPNQVCSRRVAAPSQLATLDAKFVAIAQHPQ